MPKIQVLNKQVGGAHRRGARWWIGHLPLSKNWWEKRRGRRRHHHHGGKSARGGASPLCGVTDNGCGIAPRGTWPHRLPCATPPARVVGGGRLELHRHLGLPRRGAGPPSPPWPHVELLTRTPGRGGLGLRYTCGGAEEPTLGGRRLPRGAPPFLVRDFVLQHPRPHEVPQKGTPPRGKLRGGAFWISWPCPHPEISFRFLRGRQGAAPHPGGTASSPPPFTPSTAGSSPPPSSPSHYELGHVKVEGFISAPTSSRPNRSMQNFFINGRYIRSRTAMAALGGGLQGAPSWWGSFPACVLAPAPLLWGRWM